MCSSLDEIIDVNGCVSGATNSSVCRACPSGSYSNATGGVLMAKQKSASVCRVSTLAHTPRDLFLRKQAAEVACQAVQHLLGTGYSRKCKAKRYSEREKITLSAGTYRKGDVEVGGGGEGREEEGRGGLKRADQVCVCICMFVCVFVCERGRGREGGREGGKECVCV
jgi:hypothetical protein